MKNIKKTNIKNIRFQKSQSMLPGKYEIDTMAYLSLLPGDAVNYNATVSAFIAVEE